MINILLWKTTSIIHLVLMQATKRKICSLIYRKHKEIMSLGGTIKKELYPVLCLHWMLFINVAAQSNNIKILRAEWARKLLPYIIIPVNFFKTHEHICTHRIFLNYLQNS